MFLVKRHVSPTSFDLAAVFKGNYFGQVEQVQLKQIHYNKERQIVKTKNFQQKTIHRNYKSCNQKIYTFITYSGDDEYSCKTKNLIT